MVKIFNKSDNPIKEITKKFFLKVKEDTINDEEHSVTAVVSDDSVDFHHEAIALEAWQPKDLKAFLNNGGMFLSRHDMGWISPTLMSQIGFISKVWVDKKTKQVLAKFNWLAGKGNQEADWGWVLASLGTAAFSVGVAVLSYKEEEITEHEWISYSKAFRTYLKVSLKEVSQVLFPANNNARQNAIVSPDPFVKEYGQQVTNKNILEVTGAKSYADYLVKKGADFTKVTETIVDYEKEALEKATKDGFIKKESVVNTQEITLESIKQDLNNLSQRFDEQNKDEGEPMPEENEVLVIEKDTDNKTIKESDLDVQKTLSLILKSLEGIKQSIDKTDARVTLLLDSSTKEEVKKTIEQEAASLLGKLMKGVSQASTSILGSVSSKSQVEKNET